MSAKWKGRCWLVHGFNVRDGGRGSVLKLAPYLEAVGIEPRPFRYGFLGLAGVKAFDAKIAQMLFDAVDEGDYFIGHSNGCCVGHMAAKLGARFAAMAYINPALDRDAPLAKQVGRLDVWHSPSDLPVKLARLIPFARWGDMGSVGYRGVFDTRIRSHDKQHEFRISSSCHSDVFKSDKLKFFAPIIVDALLTP